MFQGWVERWPQQFDMDGTYPQVTPEVVDSFAVLSQTILKAPFFMDALALGPRFFYPLNDQANSGTAVDITNTYQPAQVLNSPFGAGVIAQGASLSSNNANLGILGHAGPALQFSNAPVASGTTNAAATFLDLTTAGINGPVDKGQGWSRVIAFNCGTIPAGADGTIWLWNPQTFQEPYGGSVGWILGGSSGAGPGEVFFRYGASGIASIVISGNLCDGNWHLLQVSVPAGGLSATYGVDGSIGGTSSFSSNVTINNIGSDAFGAGVFRGVSNYELPYTGSVSTAIEFPYALSTVQMQNLYASWRSCWSGDTASLRYGRILNWANYPGIRVLETSATTNMGPATDCIPTNDGGGNLTTSGTDALTALTNVVITENGNHFIDASGVLQFKARTDRYQPFVAQVTFGEKTALGEIPYEDCKFDFDPTQVGNDVQVTRNSTNQVFFSEGNAQSPINPGSQARYGVRTLQRTINSNGTTEPQDAANFYLYRYGNADTRVSTIKVHVSALYNSSPTAWSQMLGLELGAMVTVNRRPTPNFPAISWNGFIESIHWDMKPREAYVTFQISPADKYQFWLYSSLHGTVHTQATAGSNQFVINPLPDAATNPAKCNFCFQQNIVIEPGTVRAEALGVSSVSTTVAGYTSATLTLSANMAFTHPVNSVWATYENAMSASSQAQLTTNPGYWDAYAKLGQTTIFAY